ncbi:MAG TPA: hypothetical protein PL082_08810, partial [Tepidiformaceae bacterium]|nr:hypothetical protein [Tepidiformaceae bacterium]
EASGGGGGLRIVEPHNGSVFFLAPELRTQGLALRAEASAGAISLTFLMDGARIGTLPPGEGRLIWELSPGAHSLQVIALQPDGSTVTASSTFEVRPR